MGKKAKPGYIEATKEYWGPEFSALAGIPHQPEHNEIAAMGAHTIAYHIADNFQNGKFREEILKLVGIKP